MPAIAVSGMAFYTGNKLPKWKGDVFVGSLRFGEIPGTGHLERILFDEKNEELRREWLLADLRQWFHAYLEFGLSSPNEYRCAFILPSVSPPCLRPSIIDRIWASCQGIGELAI